MGINGLLPVLKSITKPTHVSKYKGTSVAVDGYSWLHKGAYCCSKELCEGVFTDKFVQYFLSRVDMLRRHDVEPFIIFDGARLPLKADEENSRHRSRAEAKQRAAAHIANGNVNAALECYQRAVDVTPAMAKQVIEALKERGVRFLVAPYEADAQIAFLARSGAVHAVITEDSDLVAYACPRVLFKLDKAGMGEELLLADLPANKGLSLAGFSHDMFLQMCILAGCDFLSSCPGIGLKKAHQQLRKFKSFVKVCKMLRFDGTSVPKDYEARFQLALWTFRHQRVYDPDIQKVVHLTPLPSGGIGAADVDWPPAEPEPGQQQQQLNFLGPLLDDAAAHGIATGELDPMTRQPFDLAAIYRGCANPPPKVAAALGRQQSGAGASVAADEERAALLRRSSGCGRIGMSRRASSGAASKAPAAAAKNGIARYFSGGSTAAPQQPRQAPQEEDAIQPPAKRQKSPQHGECRVGNLMPSVAACGRASSAATEQGGGGGWHSGSAAASAAGWDFGVPQLLLPGPRRKAAVEAGAFGVGESCAAQQPGSTSFDRSLLGGAAAAQTGAGAAAPPRHLGLWSQLDADIGSGGWRGAAAEVLGAGGRVLAGDSFLQQQQPQPSLSIPLSTGCLGSDASLGTASVPASGSSMLADSRSLASLPLSSAGGSNPLAFASCPQGGSLWGDGSLCSSMGPGSQPGSSWPGSGSLPGGSEGGNGRAMSALHSLGWPGGCSQGSLPTSSGSLRLEDGSQQLSMALGVSRGGGNGMFQQLPPADDELAELTSPVRPHPLALHAAAHGRPARRRGCGLRAGGGLRPRADASWETGGEPDLPSSQPASQQEAGLLHGLLMEAGGAAGRAAGVRGQHPRCPNGLFAGSSGGSSLDGGGSPLGGLGNGGADEDAQPLWVPESPLQPACSPGDANGQYEQHLLGREPEPLEWPAFDAPSPQPGGGAAAHAWQPPQRYGQGYGDEEAHPLHDGAAEATAEGEADGSIADGVRSIRHVQRFSRLAEVAVTEAAGRRGLQQQHQQHQQHQHQQQRVLGSSALANLQPDPAAAGSKPGRARGDGWQRAQRGEAETTAGAAPERQARQAAANMFDGFVCGVRA